MPILKNCCHCPVFTLLWKFELGGKYVFIMGLQRHQMTQPDLTWPKISPNVKYIYLQLKYKASVHSSTELSSQTVVNTSQVYTIALS